MAGAGVEGIPRRESELAENETEALDLSGEQEEQRSREAESMRTLADAGVGGPLKSEKAEGGDLEESKDVIWVEWEPNDPENPYHWPVSKKWTTTLLGCLFTYIVAFQGTSFAMGFRSMERELNCSPLLAALSLSTFPLGFGLAPLVLAPFSEVYGRLPVYLGSCIIWMIFFIPQALAKNVATIAVTRFIAGCAASTGSTLVGGSCADIFLTHDRGPAMSAFAFAAFVGSGMGPATTGYLAQNLGWRWIQWLQMCMGGVLLVSLVLFMKEHRGSVLLSRRAARLRKETGDPRYQCKSDAERASLIVLVKGSLTRPMVLLFTDAVVFAFSMFIALGWSVLYLLLQAQSLVFGEVYGFSLGEIGLTFWPMALGGIFGWYSNRWQEKLYQKNVAKRGPEARLYAACAGGIALFAGIFIFGFAQGRGHWIGPCIGLFIAVTGVFHMYLAVFNYLADCYSIFASSALAAQSFCRNMGAFSFPLFTTYYYRRLGFTYASMTTGLLALGLSVVPFGLFFWGPKIRAKSKFAQRLAQIQKQS